MNIKNIFFSCILLLSGTQSFAGTADQNTPVANDSTTSSKVTTKADEIDVQKIIDEYKTYLANVPSEIREEVVDFRKKIADLNKQKRDLYRKLSAKSQDYLKEEQKYKKRLPLEQKKMINMQQGDNK